MSFAHSADSIVLAGESAGQAEELLAERHTHTHTHLVQLSAQEPD